MTEKVYDKGAQSREAHARYRFEDIYPAIMPEWVAHGVVMDIGAGVARDAVAMHERMRTGTRTKPLVIGIDPDEANYHKAVETYPHKDIVLCRDWNDVAGVKRHRQIAYLIGELQHLPGPPSKLRADFINCSAVLMFVPQDEQAAFVKALHNFVRRRGDVFLRFRTEMLKEGMTKVDMPTLIEQCRSAGFNIDKLPDFPDPPPSSRDFMWHDLLLAPKP